MPLFAAKPIESCAVGIDVRVVQQSPALAVNVAGFPAMALPVAVAVSVFVLPHVEPMVQLTVAVPFASVFGVLLFTLPLPAAGVKVTVTFGTGFPYWSVTLTAGAMGTVEAGCALCWFPAPMAIWAAGPGSAVAVKTPYTCFCPLDNTARTSTLCVWAGAVEVPSVQ